MIYFGYICKIAAYKINIFALYFIYIDLIRADVLFILICKVLCLNCIYIVSLVYRCSMVNIIIVFFVKSYLHHASHSILHTSCFHFPVYTTHQSSTYIEAQIAQKRLKYYQFSIIITYKSFASIIRNCNDFDGGYGGL